MNDIAFFISAGLYGVATGLFVAFLLMRRSSLSTAAWWVLLAGFLFHTLTLVGRYISLGYTPVANRHESISFLAWTTVLIYLKIQKRYRMEVLGAFTSPVALALILFSMFFSRETVHLDPVLRSPLFPIHVFFAFLGDALLALAAIVGVMYLIQERQLKSKRVGPWYHRLPSLNVLDELNYRCVTIGFPALTLGIITGSVWLQLSYGTWWNWDPRLVWSMITWCFYAALIHTRMVAGWRGRRTALLTILGFFIVVGTFLGVEHFIQE